MSKRVYGWLAIQRYIDEGHGFVACHKRFGIWHATWVRAVETGRLSAPLLRGRPRMYDWGEVQEYYDEGHSVRQCMSKFGFSAASWDKARKRGEMWARPIAMPLDELMRRGKSRFNVKVRLLRYGLLKDECSTCGLTRWRGKRLSLHIDHINGVKNDRRLENLRMLCPNCHSQTETYGGRNAKKRRQSLQDPGGTV